MMWKKTRGNRDPFLPSLIFNVFIPCLFLIFLCMPWIVRKDDPVAARGLSGRTTQLNGRTSSPAHSTAHTSLCKAKLQLQFLRKSFFWAILLCSGPTLTSIPRALISFMSLGDNG